MFVIVVVGSINTLPFDTEALTIVSFVPDIVNEKSALSILRLSTIVSEKVNSTFPDDNAWLENVGVVVNFFCERVYVMQKGRIIEDGTCKEIFKNPKEAYTKELFSSSYLK